MPHNTILEMPPEAQAQMWLPSDAVGRVLMGGIYPG